MTYLVILDPGHGLDTAGKRTPLFDDGTFMHENEFNRSVVRKIDYILEQYENIDVVYTTTEKREIVLPERIARVNELYEKVKGLYDKIVLVSVHANALTGEWGSQNGTETYYYPTNPVDKAFAETIHKHLVQATNLKDRGVIGEKFYIIKNAKMTACLCECAFMDNFDEAKLLMTDEFRQACAAGIVNGLKEYFEIEINAEATYQAYNENIHEIVGSPEKFGSKIVKKSNRKIEEPFCINGSFQWWEDAARQNPYPTSILIQDGVILRNEANHLDDSDSPQSVYIVYKNGDVDMKLVKYATDLDYKNIKCAVGGMGLVNTEDSNFRYSPVTEGFFGKYADVLRRSDKTVYGYNIKTKQVYLLVVKNCTMTELMKIITNNSSGTAYNYGVMGDGGGSVFLNNATDMVVYGDGRTIYAILGFGL
jgi:N-acetylmuramoyl-L-alanine amidase